MLCYFAHFYVYCCVRLWRQNPKTYQVRNKTMPTSSFDKEFIVTDYEAIRQLKSDMENPIKVTVKKRNYESDRRSGIQIIKDKLGTEE
jgi:hypothetical protein